MTTKFWDSLNSCEEEGVKCSSKDISEALVHYAEHDHEGLCDGLYVKQHKENPQPFTVRLADGTEEQWEVYGEYEIRFHARRIS